MIIQHLEVVAGNSDAFEANVHSLSSFIKEDLALSVPKYQREYVWGRENIRRFLDDIEDHRLVDMKEFFIGSVICSTPFSKNPPPREINNSKLRKLERLVKDQGITQNLPDNPKKIDLIHALLGKIPSSKLVDGQQRMTTISIISTVLIGWFKHLGITNNEKELRNIIRRDIAGNDRERLRLSLRPGDDSYYETITSEHKHDHAKTLHDDKSKWDTKTPAKGSRYRAMRTAYLEIDSWFREFHEKYEAKEKVTPKAHFSKFADYLLNNVKIIFINVKDNKQEQAVFQSLNATGESLTESEKVKSHLFHRATLKSCTEKVESYWSEMMTTLDGIERWNSSDPATEFLHIWAKAKGIGAGDGVLSRKMVFNSIRSYIDREDLNTQKGLEGLATELKNDALSYKKILNPDVKMLCYEDLIDFRANGVQHLPFFLAVYKQNSDKSTKELQKSVIAASNLFDVLDGRTRLTGTITSNKVETPLNKNWIRWYRVHGEERAHKKIKLDIWNMLLDINKVDIGTTFEDKMDKLDEDFDEQLTSKVDSNHAKYYLRKIEDIGGWRDYNRMELQAEHIFPNSQKRSGKFLWWSETKNFGVNSWWPETKEERQREANTLGNYLIIEEELNNIAERRTWMANTRKGKLYLNSTKNLSSMGQGAGKTVKWQNLIKEKGGKFHVYTRLKHESHVSGGPKVHYGSQLKHVKNFCKRYIKNRNWTPGMMHQRTKVLAKKGAKKKCWSLRDWDIEKLQAEENFLKTKEGLETSKNKKKLESIDLKDFEGKDLEKLEVLKKKIGEKIEKKITDEKKKKIIGEISKINPGAVTEGLELDDLKVLKKTEKKQKNENESESQQKKWSKIAMKVMVPGTKYGKKEIIEHIQDNYEDFTKEELSENASEKAPKWHRWVGNALRCTPDSDSIPQNWWVELRANKEGRAWKYYLED